MYGHMPKKERGYINMSERKGFFKSFKEFAMKGNVVDMAVGVIIGGAFGKIVTSLVNDIIMPALGLLIGNISFSELTWVISAPTESEPGISIAYRELYSKCAGFPYYSFEHILCYKRSEKGKRKIFGKETAGR